jgi:Holliday junction resolvase RusA-like endonuclease
MSTAALFEPPVAAPVIDQACPFPGRWSLVCSFFAAGTPKGQPRPRAFARKFGDTYQARVYDAGTAEGWKSEVAIAAKPHLPIERISGPVRIELSFFLPRPQRLCRKRDPVSVLLAICKPDADNFAKAVLDCLTAIGMWHDDSQVASLQVGKFYHAIGQRPGAQITLWRLDGA